MILKDIEKQRLVQEIFDKISNVFRLNGVEFARLPQVVQSATIMVYQEGLKAAYEKGFIKKVNKK
mgnify:CR=1 FL=1